MPSATKHKTRSEQRISPTGAGYEVCILAGGRSDRMGRDKSRLRLGGRTLLGRIRATALGLGLPVRVIRRDRVPRCGPLGGVHTALVTSRADTSVFLSCDMPFVSLELLKLLITRMKKGDPALFVVDDDRAGFPFVLRRDAARVIGQQLAAGQFSLQKLAQRLRPRLVRLSARFQPQLVNINTPADWNRAKLHWSRGGRSLPPVRD